MTTKARSPPRETHLTYVDTVEQQLLETVRPLADVVCQQQADHSVPKYRDDQERLSSAKEGGDGNHTSNRRHTRHREECLASSADLEGMKYI